MHARSALVLVAALTLAACKDDPRDAAAPPLPTPTPVQVATVEPAPATSTFALTGVVRARREADVGFRAGGRIIERLADVGVTVEAGQPLARLDPRDLALAVRSAEADLAAADAAARQAANDAARSRALLRDGWVSAAANDAKVT